MLIENSRGSEWHKCDLHLHSTASDGTAKPEELVDEAIKKGIKMIALTDHHTVDNIDEIKRYGKNKDIVVISGIEFRTEYGQKSVHMIGLFPDKYNGIELKQSALEELILNPLGLSKTLITQKGLEKCGQSKKDPYKEGLLLVQVEFKKAADLIHQYGGIVTVHAGGKSNSFDEEMKHEGKANKNVSLADSLGPVKEELLNNYIDICEVRNQKEAPFYLNNWNKPCIAASDAHSISEFGRNYCWVKCKPSFEGLKQIIYEPESRVKIQDIEPDEKLDYLVIDSIEVDHKEFGKQIIPFNQNLNVIIGGRSSGKSILLSCIARLCGNNVSIKPDKPQYDSYINNIVQSMKIVWRDKQLESNRKIDFFPQSNIIDTASNPVKISSLVENLLRDENGENKELAILKGKNESTRVFIHSLFSEYRKMKEELSCMYSDIETIGNVKSIQQEVSKLETAIAQIKKTIEDGLSDYEKELYDNQIEQITNYKSKIQINKRDKQDIENLKSESIFLNMDYSFNAIQNDEKRKNIIAAYNEIKEDATKKWLALIDRYISESNEMIEISNKGIDYIKANPVYIKASKIYEENTRLSQTVNNLDVEKEKLKNIAVIEKRINQAQCNISKIKDDIINYFYSFYSNQNGYCELHEIEKEDIKIIPQTIFQTKIYQDIVNKYFDGRSTKNYDVLKFEYENFVSFSEFTRKLLLSLLDGDFVLRGGSDPIEVAEYLFSSNLFRIEYNIEFQGDRLREMSEGKTAFVILRLLLDFSKNEYPILIDQPEDDLDNRAIYQDLVSYLREKKLKRQIILVTHNPNVVVGADAEEIIVANQNGIGNKNPDEVKFAYIAGALEDSFKNNDESILLKQGIREHVCDILEGGDEAFELREKKYQLNKQRAKAIC